MPPDALFPNLLLLPTGDRPHSRRDRGRLGTTAAAARGRNITQVTGLDWRDERRQPCGACRLHGSSTAAHSPPSRIVETALSTGVRTAPVHPAGIAPTRGGSEQ